MAGWEASPKSIVHRGRGAEAGPRPVGTLRGRKQSIGCLRGWVRTWEASGREAWIWSRSSSVSPAPEVAHALLNDQYSHLHQGEWRLESLGEVTKHLAKA